MNRAYSLLVLKAVDEEQRILEGIATTPSPDRADDIIELDGLDVNLPTPFLLQHDSRSPMGQVISARKTSEGLVIKVQIAAQGLLDYIDTGWKQIKAGLVRGLSIGFRPLEWSFLEDSGGIRFIKSELLEVSAVTIPMNAEASITAVKSADADVLAALGMRERRPVFLGKHPSTSPGASGFSKGKESMKTVSEQIAGFEAKIAANTARQKEIMQKSADDGRTLESAEKEEYDRLKAETKDCTDHIARLKEFEADIVAGATRVTPDNTQTHEDASRLRGAVPNQTATQRGSVQVRMGANLPAGTGFTRYAMALAACQGHRGEAMEYAKRWRDSTPEVERVLRSAMTAGTTTDADWAQPLAEYQNLASEFVALLRPLTILGRLTGTRRVPFNVKVPTQTQASSVGWVGQGVPKPVSELKFGQLTLGMAKAAGIVVLSEELVRSSSPAAEDVVRQDMIASISQFLDKQLVDPTVAEVSNVSPASITYGVTPVYASGTTAADLLSDVQTLFQNMTAAGLSLSTATWLMPTAQAVALSLMRNALGQREFPELGVLGGTFLGLPVIVSDNVVHNAGSGSPITNDGDRIILVNAGDILLADDGQVTLDISREASLQMDSAPTNPPVAATVLVSLWQLNLVGIKAERFINWKKRRDAAVQFIDRAKYGS